MNQRLPAALVPGRPETVMSGGKCMLGGSSTSASGPSAILPECHDVQRGGNLTKLFRHAMDPAVTQAKDVDINKRDCCCR